MKIKIIFLKKVGEEEEEEGQQKNANLMPHTEHPKLATPKKRKRKKKKKKPCKLHTINK